MVETQIILYDSTNETCNYNLVKTEYGNFTLCGYSPTNCKQVTVRRVSESVFVQDLVHTECLALVDRIAVFFANNLIVMTHGIQEVYEIKEHLPCPRIIPVFNETRDIVEDVCHKVATRVHRWEMEKLRDSLERYYGILESVKDDLDILDHYINQMDGPIERELNIIVGMRGGKEDARLRRSFLCTLENASKSIFERLDYLTLLNGVSGELFTLQGEFLRLQQ